jgi:cytochrome c oxidase subunit 3
MPPEGTSHLHEHYDSLEKQESSARLGMWLFLSTEVLFFAALFVAYGVYRSIYADEFEEATHHMNVVAGTVNTYVLITSSLFVVLAHHYSRAGRSRLVAVFVGLAALLGMAFMVIKGFEYVGHIHEGLLPGSMYAYPAMPSPGASMFVTLYWMMTGLHAFHVAVGIAVLSWLCVASARGKFSAEYHTPVEISGMYWHFVDAVWVFLYPMFYLL